MKVLNEKKVISDIIHSRISSVGSYKVFIIKTTNQDNGCLDIGLDCNFSLDPKNKYLIANEIREKLNHDNFFLVDFSFINEELKNRMYRNFEFIS